MRSAFGVEHGEVAKAFRKVNPKLISSLKGASEPPKTQTMDQRIKHNYAMFRGMSGGIADKNAKSSYRAFEGEPTARQWKDMARAQVTAAGNRSKRKGRKLP